MESKLYEILAEVKSPLHIGVGRVFRGILSESMEYIPATAVRGAFGREVFREHCKRKECTPDCVERGSCPYDLAFSEYGDEAGFYSTPLLPACESSLEHETMITPSYVVECKLQAKNCRLSSFHKEILDKRSFNVDYKCKYCKSPYVERAGGVVCSTCKKLVSSKMTQITSTKISESSGAAEEAQLFVKDYIAEGQALKGYILATKHPDPIEYLAEAGAMEKKGSTYTWDTRLGGAKSRGYGRVHFTMREISLSSYLEERARRIKDSMQDEVLLATCTTPLFTLTLEHGVFTSKPMIEAKELRRHLARALASATGENLAGLKLSVIAASGDPCYTSGWSSKTSLRRPYIMAAAPGSTFLLKLENVTQEALKALALLELIGYSSPQFYSKLGYGKLICYKVI